MNFSESYEGLPPRRARYSREWSGQLVSGWVYYEGQKEPVVSHVMSPDLPRRLWLTAEIKPKVYAYKLTRNRTYYAYINISNLEINKSIIYVCCRTKRLSQLIMTLVMEIFMIAYLKIDLYPWIPYHGIVGLLQRINKV